MPRFGKRVLISSSQEEILEAITGWDDTRQAAGIIDETPGQPAYTENSSQSSLERVFDVTGSSLCSGPSQEAVELVSPTDMSPTPRTTWNVAFEEREEEDSYNEAFESDRSQSPPRTVSWSCPAGARGCKDGPKSRTLNAVALEEVEMLPLSTNLKLVNEVEVSSNRPIAIPPEAPGVTTRMRAGLEVDQEAVAAEEDPIANSGHVNVVQLVVELKMGEDDHSGKEVKSGDKCRKRRSRVEHELDTMERVGGRGVSLDRVAAHSKALKDDLGTPRAADHGESGKELLGGQENSREPLLSPPPSKSLMDAETFRSADKTGVAPAGATEGGRQCSPPSSPRPPRAVQEKLNKLRSQMRPKRAHSESFNLLTERLRTEQDMVSSSTVLEAIKLRSGELPASNVTAADLLKTALAIGIIFPPPFHRNYFSE